MISKFSILEKYLNYLLLFIFPTQLALHFWPDFALVYGIRVDYLSPTIYLTDVIFFFLFLNWLIKNKKSFLRDFADNRFTLLLLLLFMLLNIYFSGVFVITIIKWLRIIELICLGYYAKQRRDIFSKTIISRILFISLVTFSLIGLLQFSVGRTLGGPLYWLGERSFTVHTPGISLVNLFGKNYLRIYSTFPHPNSFAGFLGIAVIFIIFNPPKINKYLFAVGLSVVLTSFVLSFSLGAYIATGVCLISYFIFRYNIFKNKTLNYYLIFVFLISLSLLLFSKTLLNSDIQFSQSTVERLKLNIVAGKLIQDKFLTGVGLNNFFVDETKHLIHTDTVWLLQPVHNVFVLILSETGIFGLLLLYLLPIKFIKKIISTKNTCSALLLVFVLTTAVFDHYWFTIYQNLILLAFLIGISVREK